MVRRRLTAVFKPSQRVVSHTISVQTASKRLTPTIKIDVIFLQALIKVFRVAGSLGKPGYRR